MEFLLGCEVELQTKEDKFGCIHPTSGFECSGCIKHLQEGRSDLTWSGGLMLTRGIFKQVALLLLSNPPRLRSASVSTLRHPTPRCCLGWSRSAARAGYPTCSFSFCGWVAPVSVWSWPPTSSAALSRPPLLLVPPPLLPPPSLCHLDSSVWRRRALKAGCLTDARGVHSCSHHFQNRVYSRDHLQAGSQVAH